MFKDKYGLTDAVLQGRKTMTRRIIRNLLNFDPRQDWIVLGNDDKGKASIAIFHNETYKYSIYPQYQPGEVVDVAQSYKDLGYTKEWVEQHISPNPNANWNDPFEKKYPGWSNKMFVPAKLNKAHQIRITDIKVDRLQDISDVDCLREGILKRDIRPFTFIEIKYQVPKTTIYKDTPREAFAALINKINGKGTFEKSPYVFVYSFELVK